MLPKLCQLSSILSHFSHGVLASDISLSADGLQMIGEETFNL